jgi:ribosomal protein S18 acetylase RimI-like enzyme
MDRLEFEELPWDTEHFGVRVARAECGEVTRGVWNQCADWTARRGVECVYLLSSRPALDRRPLDSRTTLRRPLSQRDAAANDTQITEVRAADLGQLVEIARQAHRDSRFYRDPRFGAERGDALFRIWIEKSCAGWADAVLVARAGENVAGYCTLHFEKEAGRIGLIAVAPRYQRLGWGRRLLQGALRILIERGVARATVVTQGENAAAMAMYQSMGFEVEQRQYWYHYWRGQNYDE